MAKAKELISLNISNLIDSYEEEGRKVVAKRMEQGWNFCHFFLLKEGLVFVMRKINDLNGCLHRYNELELTFFQEDQKKRLDYFVILEKGDDSPQVLDVRRKSYRSSIYANTITEFDFRTYLFARTVNTLFELKNLSTICTQTLKFLQSMSRDIKAHEHLFPKGFRSCWVFAVARSVISQVEADDQTKPPDVAQLLSDLYYFALRKVISIFDSNLLPSIQRFKSYYHLKMIYISNLIKVPVLSKD